MSIPEDVAGPLAEAAKEIIPTVYADGIQPSLKELGRTLHGVVRTVLRPINAIVWTVDEASDWLEQRVAQFLERRGIDSDRVIRPSPQILYGAIRGIQATGTSDQSELQDMYAKLLATAMDPDTASSAHPAFADLLMQMLPDEARVIRLLETRGGDALVSLALDAWFKDPELPGVFQRKIESLAQEAECLKTSAIESYLDNLKRLALIEEKEFRWERHRTGFPLPTGSEAAAALLGIFGYDFPPVANAVKEFLEFRDKSGTSWVINARKIHLTAFGMQFVDACVAAID